MITLVPLVGILFPLFRGLPAVRTWYVERRVALFYGELKLLELEMEAPGGQASDSVLIKKLDELEARVSHLRVPEDFAALVYALRHHIRLVRERLERPPEAP